MTKHLGWDSLFNRSDISTINTSLVGVSKRLRLKFPASPTTRSKSSSKQINHLFAELRLRLKEKS